MTDVFLDWGKHPDEMQQALTDACELAGLDPQSDADRSMLLTQIRDCRTGRCETELPKLQALAESYCPTFIQRVASRLQKLIK